MKEITNLPEIKKEAQQIFWNSLSYKKLPAPESIRLASAETENYLMNQILSYDISPEVKEKLRVLFIEKKFPLSPADVITDSQVSVHFLSIAGLAGSAAGGYLFDCLSTVFSWTSALPVIIGAAAGAFIFTLEFGKILTNSKFLQKIIKPEETFNIQKTSAILNTNINSWFSQVFTAVDLLSLIYDDSAEGNNSEEALTFVLSELEKIKELTDKKDIENELDYIMKYLEKYGYSYSTEKDKIWNEKLSEFYDTFGVLEEGDCYIIEKKAIISNSRIIEKGLVRKKR